MTCFPFSLNVLISGYKLSKILCQRQNKINSGCVCTIRLLACTPRSWSLDCQCRNKFVIVPYHISVSENRMRCSCGIQERERENWWWMHWCTSFGEHRDTIWAERNSEDFPYLADLICHKILWSQISWFFNYSHRQKWWRLWNEIKSFRIL